MATAAGIDKRLAALEARSHRSGVNAILTLRDGGPVEIVGDKVYPSLASARAACRGETVEYNCRDSAQAGIIRALVMHARGAV